MSSEQTVIAKLAVLGDDVRARLFAFVRRARRPVTRVEAATEVGISAKLAAFHLDKLVEAGLLAEGRDTPPAKRKVGRTPKLYEAGGDLALSIPPRRPELLAAILTEAVSAEQAAGGAKHAALNIAAERGRTMGRTQRETERPGRLGIERALTLACARLEEAGFEPERATPTLVRLRNCPFHPLAAQAPDLVCGINQAFLSGYLQGLDAPDSAEAVLAPSPDACCVELRSLPGKVPPGEPDTDDAIACHAEPEG